MMIHFEDLVTITEWWRIQRQLEKQDSASQDLIWLRGVQIKQFDVRTKLLSYNHFYHTGNLDGISARPASCKLTITDLVCVPVSFCQDHKRRGAQVCTPGKPLST